MSCPPLLLVPRLPYNNGRHCCLGPIPLTIIDSDCGVLNLRYSDPYK